MTFAKVLSCFLQMGREKEGEIWRNETGDLTKLNIKLSSFESGPCKVGEPLSKQVSVGDRKKQAVEARRCQLVEWQMANKG